MEPRNLTSTLEKAPRPGCRRRGEGFTFLELILVLAVMSCLFAIGIPAFRNLAPRYRLRSSARSIGSTLENVRIAAMGRGLWMGMHYVLTPGSRDEGDNSYYQVIPPPPEDFPDQPVVDRKLLAKEELPQGVRIAKVILSGGQTIDRGSINVLFSPMGNAGSHIVVLEGQDGQFISLKMSCITGIIEFFDSADVGFQHYAE